MPDDQLTPEQAKHLDSNIRNMLSKGATQEDVMNYANDYKTKFVVKKKEPVAPIQLSGGLEGFIPSLKESQDFGLETPSIGKKTEEQSLVGEASKIHPGELTIGYKASDAPTGYDEGKPTRAAKTTAGVYNTLVESAARLVGGTTKVLQDASGSYLPTIPKGVLPDLRKPAVELVEKLRSPVSSKEEEAKAGEFDIKKKTLGQNIKSLLFSAPSMVADVMAGVETGGATFILQGVNDAAEEIDNNPEAQKMPEELKVGYQYTSGLVNAALMRFNFDKVLKGTGVDKWVTKNITDKVVKGFIDKGIKATAEEINAAVGKEVSTLATKAKKVGLKAAVNTLSGGATGAAMAASHGGLQGLVNLKEGKEVFDTKNIGHDILNSAASLAMFSGLAGGVSDILKSEKPTTQEPILEQPKAELHNAIAEAPDNLNTAGFKEALKSGDEVTIEQGLKDISQQLNSGADAREATIRQFGEKLTNLAEEKYPNEKVEVTSEEAKKHINEEPIIQEPTQPTEQVAPKEEVGAMGETQKVEQPTEKKSVLERPIEEVSIDDILKELQGDNEGLAFKNMTNKDIKEGDAKDIEQYNQRAERVLKTLYPNAEFKALETNKEYEQATGRKNEAGVLMRGKEGKHQLFLNLEAIKDNKIERTATHEVIHALVSDAIGVKYTELNKKWEDLWPKLSGIKGFETVRDHLQNYSFADRPVEGITDVLANIVHNKIKIEDVPKTLWDDFIELVNKTFEAIGIKYKITPDTFNGFAKSVKEAFDTGNFEHLQKFVAKGKTEKFFKENPEYAQGLSMVDPAKRKQLQELLKQKVQQEVESGKLSQEEADKIFEKYGEKPPTIEPPKEMTGEGEPETDQRRFTKQMLRDEDLTPEAKGEIAKTLDYVVQTNAMSLKEANEIIDKSGLQEAHNLVINNGDIKPVVRVVMGQELIKKYNYISKNAADEGTKNHYLDKAIQVANLVTEKLATEAGQQIQAFSLWSRLSPEGQLRAAGQDIAKQSKEKLARREKDINVISEKFKKANEEAADELTKTEGVKKAVEKTDSIRTKKAKDRIAEAKKKRESIIKKYKSDKGKSLYSSPTGLTPEGIEFVGDIVKTYVQEGVARLEVVVEKVLAHLKEVSGKVPNDEVKKNVSDIVSEHISKQENQRIIKGLSELEKEVNKIVREHYTIPEEAKKKLVDKFIEDAGLEKPDAEQLSREIQTEFDKIATRKKRNILYNEKARFDKINKTLESGEKKSPKTVQDEIIKYSNLGAFEGEDFKGMVANKFGLGKLTTEQAAKIMELAEKVQKAPEGTPKKDATEDLLAYRANLKGNNLSETAQAVWYSNVLSGYKTHEKNIVSTFFQSMGELAAEMTKDPKAIPYIMAGYIKGISKRGFVEAVHTFRTGRSPIHIKKIETPTTLERKQFIGGGLNPGNWFKYVTRLMVAEDVLSFQGLKEARAYQLARKEASKLGVNTWSKKGWDKVNEILLHTKERWQIAEEQTKQEGLKPNSIEQRRRIYELMEDSRPTQMTEDAYGFAAHGTFNHESEGTLGAITNAVASALDAVNVGGFKPLRIIVPFTRIITNVVNNSLDFTPVGLIRAARGERGFKAFQEHQITKSAYKKLSTDERNRLVAKAAIGITLTATLQALHQAGIIQITGAGPDDPKKKMQLQQEGWQPYSIKVGKKYYSYQYTPLVFMAGFLGNMNDASEYGEKESEKTFGKRMELAASRIGGQVADMTWINSASTFLGALTENNPNAQEKKISNLFSSSAKGFIPFSGAVTQTSQLYQSLFNMPQKQVNNAWQSLIQDIPIARNSLNDKINALGDPITRDIDVIMSKETSDPVWKYLLDKQGWAAPVNRGTLIVYDETTKRDRPVTDDEYFEFSKKRGQKIKQQINKILKEGATIQEKNHKINKTADELTTGQLNVLLSNIERDASKETKDELFAPKEKHRLKISVNK